MVDFPSRGKRNFQKELFTLNFKIIQIEIIFLGVIL